MCKYYSWFFYLNFSFALKFPVLILVRSIEKKKNVARAVSLNIDLQDMTELDRDVVIAALQRGEKRR